MILAFRMLDESEGGKNLLVMEAFEIAEDGTKREEQVVLVECDGRWEKGNKSI